VTPEQLFKLKKYTDFAKALRSLGYQEQPNKSGSHRIFKAIGKPVLSVPCHNLKCDIADGTRRKLVRLVFSA
jgi:predicted RNA binding protein YcfA (HicA-like mRNA interferase family)